MVKTKRTERSPAEIEKSLAAIKRRTELAMSRRFVGTPTVELGRNIARALGAATTLAEIFSSSPEAMTGFDSDSVASEVARALEVITGDAFHVVAQGAAGYSIREGAR